MRRVLYDSRSIPLDVLFALAEIPRGRFGDPVEPIADTRDAPKPSDDVNSEEN